MPDTTFYTNNNPVQDSAADFMTPTQGGDGYRQNYYQPTGGPLPITIVFLVIIALGWIAIRRVLKTGAAKNIQAPAANDTDEAAETQHYIYEGSKLGLGNDEITAIIVKHYPFYNQLFPTVQYRFQQRLFDFIKAKSFIIYSEQPFKEMPVLTSAAAVHLTLGLDDYLLTWFKYIAIHPQAYFAADGLRILAGNVEGEMITIAWDQLLKGLDTPNDGNNVGLHEMAHALYYQQAVVYKRKEANFSTSFEKVMHEGEEVYKLKDTQHILCLPRPAGILG